MRVLAQTQVWVNQRMKRKELCLKGGAQDREQQQIHLKKLCGIQVMGMLYILYSLAHFKWFESPYSVFLHIMFKLYLFEAEIDKF